MKPFESRFLGITWPSAELRHPEEKLFLGSSMNKHSTFCCERSLSTSLRFSNELPNPGHFPHGEVMKSVALIIAGGISFLLK